jgi:hypothetical protein
MEVKIQKLIAMFEPYFWTIFILLPIFTGWFQYHHLPNENPYDETRFEIIKSHTVEVGPEELQSAEVADVWRDKETGKVFTWKQFSEHQSIEAQRIAETSFTYGLIGCFYYAVAYVAKKKG